MHEEFYQIIKDFKSDLESKDCESFKDLRPDNETGNDSGLKTNTSPQEEDKS